MAQKASGVNASVEILAAISSFPQLTRKLDFGTTSQKK